MRNVKTLELINSLEIECKEITDMILLRIKTSPLDEGTIEDYLEDPFTLEITFSDAQVDALHAYDLGRLEAFQEIIRELRKITYNQ